VLEQEDLVSLENGCVCCSLRKDIVKALAEIERRSRDRRRRVDQVCVCVAVCGCCCDARKRCARPTSAAAAGFLLDRYSLRCSVDAAARTLAARA
jgi:hypothetical protein